MEPKLFRLVIAVSDVETAQRFYSRVLGHEGVRVSPGRHYFNCGGTILACVDPVVENEGRPPRPNPEWMYFAVDDPSAALEEALAAGAKISDEDIHGEPAGEIMLRPWGERSVYCHDPFGNKLCLVERATMFTAGL